MTHKKMIIGLVLTSMTLSGCSHLGKNEGAGTFFGTLLGAVVGREIGGSGAGGDIGMVMGGMIGASMGGEIGRKLDDADKIKYARTRHVVLEEYPSGQEGTWHNPDSGNSGTFVAEPATREDDRYCREFTQTVMIGGKEEKAYGKACRMPDGTWKIENE